MVSRNDALRARCHRAVPDVARELAYQKRPASRFVASQDCLLAHRRAALQDGDEKTRERCRYHFRFTSRAAVKRGPPDAPLDIRLD
jgi:hypothetical protein